jgi:hypothetical protein
MCRRKRPNIGLVCTTTLLTTPVRGVAEGLDVRSSCSLTDAM